MMNQHINQLMIFFESLKATDKHALNGLAIEEEDELFLDVKASTSNKHFI